jgi:hypothetical protein
MNDFSDIEITSADIKAVLDIINLTASRGALRGSELTIVGNIYDKYFNILEKVKQNQTSNKDKRD